MEGGNGNTGQPGISDQPDTLVKPTRTRRARKPTRMAKLTLRFPGKVKVVFDTRRLMAIGPNKKMTDNFRSYMGFLGRKLPSILINSWKSVPAHTKELIWQAILEKFEIFFGDGKSEVDFSLVDVKLQDQFRKKWVSYVGRRWGVFKTNLTTFYIYGKKKDEPPYVKDYEFLDRDTWDAFVVSRLTPEKKAKRLKAQEIQSHNKCPQKCSRGGYEVLSQKMIDEKYEERRKNSHDPSEIIPPPSPPPRHETWKRARRTSSGEYINEEAGIIAARIDSLQEEQSCGSFTSCGRNDILAVAIGKPDHPGRVRGVGKGYTVRTYFGRQERSVDGMVSREEVSAIVAEMQAKLQVEMQMKMREEMKMMFNSQATSSPELHTPVVVGSARGSCAPDIMENDDQHDKHDENDGDYELYVEDPHRRLVAYGRLHELGTAIHHRKMNSDEVRVSVERVVVSAAIVPFPTEEVTEVGQALNQFIAWPRRLVQNRKHKGNFQRTLFSKSSSQLNQESPTPPKNKTDVLKTLWFAAADIREPRNLFIEAGIVSSTRESVYLNGGDIMGLLATGMISVSVMKFYSKYLYNILKSSRRADRYGLMCPLTIKTHGNDEDMGLLRIRIGEGGFDIFLLPFYDKGWQLMALCPKDNRIAWFCCMGKRPKKKISEKIETAFDAYQVMKGKRAKDKPKWVYPKCYKQNAGDDECGLFVMRHMLEIIKLDIVNSFEEVLNMEEPYSNNDIDDVRTHWAECFLEVIT